MPTIKTPMRQLPYLEKNVYALEELAVTYPNIREAFEDDPNGAINYLRLLGFVCAKCGKNRITQPIMKFFHYEAHAECYECQRKITY